MTKYLIIPLLFALSTSTISAQEAEPKRKYPFVNITEIGGMFGRVKAPSYFYYYPSFSSFYVPRVDEGNFTIQNLSNFTVQTFNGVYLNPKTAIGISTGMDWFNNTLIVPIQAGMRRQVLQKKEGGAAIIGGLDLGYGTTWFHADNSQFESSGGLSLSPTIGYRIPNKTGSAWVLNFGYKHQSMKVTDTSQRFDEVYSNIETRRHNRLLVRFGFEF